jgi:beta-galactosidase
LDITPFVKRSGENVLAVRTNGHPKGAEFDTNDDWTLHGIFRSVVVFHRPQLHLEKWRISTRVDGRNALVSIESELSQKGSVETRIFDSSGRLVASSAGATAGAKANVKMTVKDARFWSAEAPELYNLEFIVRNENGRICETRRSKVGLREISWNGGVLKVNGMPVKLRGVNHHDLSHINGRAITDAEQRRDAELIKAANCNFIRTSHYPPSKALLDACDELGIYVMDEVPFGLGNRFLDDSSYGSILLERAELTLARDMNRPCVIIWSVGNENHITPISLATAKKVKAMDPSRPWCFPMQPREFQRELEKRPVSELGDVANWHYPAICGEPDELMNVLEEFTSKVDIPVFYGLKYGHELPFTSIRCDLPLTVTAG